MEMQRKGLNNMKLEEIKEGQWLYYTERAAGREYDYADYLAIATIKGDGKLHAKPVVFNCLRTGGYRMFSDLTERERGESESIPIEAFFCDSDWHDASNAQPEQDKVKWMNDNFPLNASDT